MGGTKNLKGVHAEAIKGKSAQDSFYKFTLKVFCEWVCVCVCVKCECCVWELLVCVWVSVFVWVV